MGQQHPAHGARYCITVEGLLEHACWSRWFGDLAMRFEGGHATVLEGWFADQAALHGVLARIRDLGLVLLSVRQESVD